MSFCNFRISYGSYYSYLRRYDFKEECEADVTIKAFNDGEISVKFNESLRGKHIFIFGETSKNLTELIMTLDAAKRASAEEISVVLPYYGYSRQDKREGTRGCIGAKAVAHVIESMGADRVISIDLHAAQIQGYFQVPFEHISGTNIFNVQWLLPNLTADNSVFVSPDAGGILRTLKFASLSRSKTVASINKRREKAGEVSFMELIGDVKDKEVILIDDIADTCGTLCKAADLLLQNGATKVHALATHPVLTSNWAKNIHESKLSTVFLSDTLNINQKLTEASNEGYDVTDRIRIVPCTHLLHDVIDRIANDESISHFN